MLVAGVLAVGALASCPALFLFCLVGASHVVVQRGEVVRPVTPIRTCLVISRCAEAVWARHVELACRACHAAVEREGPASFFPFFLPASFAYRF